VDILQETIAQVYYARVVLGNVNVEASVEQVVQLILFVFTTVDVEQVTSADWTQLLGVNLHGYAPTTKHILLIIKKYGDGSIVNSTT
jgi:NADP-dependent 3-hydroxy acid dehydrogenase YdfG